MKFNIKDQKFIVCGATSGFGLAIAKNLIHEGAKVIAIARNMNTLNALSNQYPEKVEVIAGDVTKSETIKKIVSKTGLQSLSGIVINAGGPPAKSFMETTLNDWDNAYNQIVRWKIELTKKILPYFEKNKYGRIVYIESASVKQPIENLVLSTSMRLSVVGFVKTLSQELAKSGITFNVMAPGYHQTPAVDRLINKKSEVENISLSKAKQKIEQGIPVGFAGDTEDFSSLALWLLSPLSKYVTGQVFAIDGGFIQGTL